MLDHRHVGRFQVSSMDDEDSMAGACELFDDGAPDKAGTAEHDDSHDDAPL
jgi:hypothetical protein